MGGLKFCKDNGTWFTKLMLAFMIIGLLTTVATAWYGIFYIWVS